jgi:tetrapyrrole methylase family protein/MazG family protein
MENSSRLFPRLPYLPSPLPFASSSCRFGCVAGSSTKPAGEEFTELVELIARLRAPGGCPWDREQTHETLKPMMLEEAYEAVEAIDEGNDEELKGELGDLLLQVVFHSQIATEENRFNVAEVINRISSKMIRRHPHVFGDDTAQTSGEVLRNWEAIKEAELEAKGKRVKEGSMLDSVSTKLPAVMEAFQMTTKVSRVDFDWPDVPSVLEKLDEEVEELKQAVGDEQPSRQEIAGEVGDLLFVAVNVARLLGIDPESALKASNRKFRRRFRYIEDRLREQGRKPADSDHIEMDELWDEAKAREKDPTPTDVRPG